MRSSALVFLLAFFTASVTAHFQLQFPPPRGVFVEDNEPTFCDGYTNSVSNRSEFPLSGGFFSLNSEHTQWTAGVLVSTLPNPQSFDNFSQVNTFFELTGEGLFCIPLDFSKSNDTSLTSGQNVTLQIVFDGGDGELFQCADLTLSNNFTIPSSVACTNASSTSTSSGTSAATATTPAGTAKTTSSAQSNYAMANTAIGVLLAVAGLVMA